MSETLGNSIDTSVLKQSLLDLKDQMSVYSTQPWSAENGHGYNEAEQYAMRDGPSTPGITGRGPSTRQANPIEPRRNLEREIDIHSHTTVQCHFEGHRYVPTTSTIKFIQSLVSSTALINYSSSTIDNYLKLCVSMT